MWYFTWILGLGFALLCGLVNLLGGEGRGAGKEDPKDPSSPLKTRKPDTGGRPFCVREVTSPVPIWTRAFR